MKEKSKIVNTLGMFDLLKGLVMLLIVFAHNDVLFPNMIFERTKLYTDENHLKYMTFVYSLSIVVRVLFSIMASFLVAMIPTLLLIAGYGFRKRDVKKTFISQAKELLKPYYITALVTSLLNIAVHYASFGYLPGALSESARVFGGMALGLTQTVTIGNITLFANGPIWYLFTMFWSITLFNVVLNKVKEEQVPYYAFGISVIGWLLSYPKFVPFCISQGMVGVLFVYIGYYLKKNKFFLKEHSTKEKIIYAIAVVIPNLVMTSFGFVTEMADNLYTLGPVTYVENGLFAILMTYIFLRVNVLRGKIAGGIRTIGRYSLYVMCVHTVEMLAFPWYTVAKKFEAHPFIGMLLVYFVRLMIIFTGCYMINRIVAFMKKRKGLL